MEKNNMSVEQMFGEFEVEVNRPECELQREMLKEFFNVDLPCTEVEETDSMWDEEELEKAFIKEFGSCLNCPFCKNKEQ